MPKRTGKGNSGSNESSVDKTKSNDKIKEILALLDINNDIDEKTDFLKNEKKIDINRHQMNSTNKTYKDKNNIDKEALNLETKIESIQILHRENITDKEIKDLEDKQLDIIAEEDFDYFFETEPDENTQKDNHDNISKENFIDNSTIEKNNDFTLSNQKNYNEEINNKNSNIKGEYNNLNQNNDYNKENWKKINDEIPVISIGKQSTNNNIIEYNIDNKFITGFGKEALKDHPEKFYFRNIEFQEKKFLAFTKNKDISKYKRVYYYCKNHRTTKGSDKIDKKGKKVRLNMI